MIPSRLTFIYGLVGVFLGVQCNSDSEDGEGNALHKIEGKVIIPQMVDQDWITNTRVLVDGGQYLGFLKSDGSFVVNNVPSGSYIVEIAHPSFVFEPSRVDITSKGKTRARRLNNLQPASVTTMTYPLKFRAKGKATYFQQREQWRITDILFNPMVMMMVLPFLMFMVLPKMMNTQDPQMQKEMNDTMSMFTNPKNNMPDISETLTNWFGGSSAKKPAIKPKATSRNKGSAR